jgi:hypothetical protein
MCATAVGRELGRDRCRCGDGSLDECMDTFCFGSGAAMEADIEFGNVQLAEGKGARVGVAREWWYAVVVPCCHLVQGAILCTCTWGERQSSHG